MFSSGCRRGILSLGAGGGFNPLTLFASGEQGGWWDPSDFSTMFQDSAGTTPVTAVTQPVGKILDKSGRGNHRTQATAGSRPTLQVDANGFFYLAYDGVDDFMLTASIDLSATNKLTVFFGTAPQNSTLAVPLEFSVSATANAGGFAYFTDTKIESYVNGGGTPAGMSFAWTTPGLYVCSSAYDLAQVTTTTQIKLRVNGVASSTVQTPGPASAGNFGNYPLYFGRRAGTSLPANFREYGTIISGRTATVGEIAQGERFIGSRMGIPL